MNRIYNILSYIVLATCFTSCYTNIIDEGMEGFVEQTTTFGAPSSEEAVDLGLSVKWAPYNVGASKPTEYGNYYAWGEIEPKTDYSSETYTGPADFFGSVDTYGTEYDVAYVKWGHEWRIPTMDELVEIQEKCKWEATEQNGVKGMKVTGSNGNSIFFPAAGRCVGNRFEDVGVTGHYWQGCANGDGSQTGEYTYYDLNAITNGLTIRPVLVSCTAYEIDKESLNDWDYGCIYGNDLYFVTKTDTTTNEIIGYFNRFSEEENGILVTAGSDNKILKLWTAEKSYHFNYEENGEIVVKSISNDGSISLLPSFNMEARGTTKTLTRSGNTQNILSQLHDFCNYYADEFAASDTPYLRSIAEDLRNLPYDVAKDGLIAGIAKLTGKKYLPYITDILEKIGDIGRENNIFGDCYVSLSGVNGSNGNYSINGTLLNASSLPELGDFSSTNFSYGILCRYVGENSNNMALPTLHYNDYNWEYNYNYQSEIKQTLPNLSFGWYIFRSYVSRNGFTKYCGYYAFFCPDLNELPNYTIRDIKCKYIGEDKVEVSFNCTLEPLNHDGILYQGLQLNTISGDKIVSFGAGDYDESVKKVFSKSLFKNPDYTNYTADLEVCAEYWYVPRWNNNTFNKELESKTITYDQEPSMTITNLSVGSTVSISEGDWDRHTSYKHDLEVTGAFWMDEVYSYYVGNWTTPGKQGSFMPYDGKISWSGDFGVKFSSEADPHSSYKYFGAIVNGTELKSTNNVVYYFNGGSCSISLSGGTRSASMTSRINNTKDSTFVNEMIIPNIRNKY